MVRPPIKPELPDEAEYITNHIFLCAICKKPRNLNRRRTLVIVGEWKSCNICSFCVAEHGLEA